MIHAWRPTPVGSGVAADPAGSVVRAEVIAWLASCRAPTGAVSRGQSAFLVPSPPFY